MKEFEEWWSPMEEQWKSSPKLIDIKGVARVGYLAGRKADEEALLASKEEAYGRGKQEGRAEAVEYVHTNLMWGRSPDGKYLEILPEHIEQVLEAAKEEKV